MSKMSQLDELVQQFPGVPAKWLEPLVMLPAKNKQHAWQVMALTVGCSLAVLEELRRQLLHSAATGEGLLFNYHQLVSVMSMLALNHVACDDEISSYGGYDSDECPFDVWAKMFGNMKELADG